MNIADVIYGDIIKDIRDNGKWDINAPVRTKWGDGTPAYTKSILNAQMKFDNGNDTLDSIITQKRVPQIDPIKEILWIWKYKSNDVKFLREELGCSVWDEWEREDGTIGKAYGWQLKNKKRSVEVTQELLNMIASREIREYDVDEDRSDLDKGELYIKIDQVDWLLYTLKTNPYSRRIKTTLWSIDDLNDMTLEPCVYETHWQMWDDKLHLTVNIRSNDMGLGNPYNVYQYSVLHRVIAHVTGHEAGTICFNIDNAHIYDRHMNNLLEQIKEPIHEPPQIWINKDIKSFYDFTVEDVKLIDYNHEKTRKMEVAI